MGSARERGAGCSAGAAGPEGLARLEEPLGEGSAGAGRKALLLNGGGISAAAWELGCLAALDEAFGEGFCARFFDIHIGVSAGAVVAALAANGILPGRVRRDILNDRDGAFNLRRTNVYRIDTWRALGKGWEAMRQLARILHGYRREGIEFSIFDLVDVVQELLPSGIFSLAPLQKHLSRAFAAEGCSDRFDDIERELYIPAIDLDRGERVVFGEEGERDVLVSEAIAASCAIPAFFRPYRIGARSFVDGCMGGHCHVDLAIRRGATLLVVVNPLVPIRCEPDRSTLPSATSGEPCGVADLGISFVGDQAFRILSRERLVTALELCRRSRPEVDILLIEPSRHEPLLFLNGPLSFRARGRILQHGYETTLRDLEAHEQAYAELFSRHAQGPAALGRAAAASEPVPHAEESS